jgi:hypothetical protein
MMIETFTPISLVNDLKASSIAAQFLNAVPNRQGERFLVESSA